MTTHHRRDRRRPLTAARRGATVVMLGTVFAGLGGCQIFGFFAAANAEYQKTKPRDIDAVYDGLKGKTFAVVVAADRMVQASYPGVVEEITARVSERLAKNTDRSGWIPPEKLLAHLYSNPRWVAMPRGELARELGVDRLILIELTEFRLHEPGNQYTWDGAASGTVAVIEGESAMPDEFVFQRAVRVKYPDGTAFTPTDVAGSAVASVLVQRFTDRASWLFYTHKETGEMAY
ncbi:MAG: hypothetical protein ACKVU4_01225 [Phycisphaerales bacterium]